MKIEISDDKVTIEGLTNEFNEDALLAHLRAGMKLRAYARKEKVPFSFMVDDGEEKEEVEKEKEENRCPLEMKDAFKELFDVKMKDRKEGRFFKTRIKDEEKEQERKKAKNTSMSFHELDELLGEFVEEKKEEEEEVVWNKDFLDTVFKNETCGNCGADRTKEEEPEGVTVVYL